MPSGEGMDSEGVSKAGRKEIGLELGDKLGRCGGRLSGPAAITHVVKQATPLREEDDRDCLRY